MIASHKKGKYKVNYTKEQLVNFYKTKGIQEDLIEEYAEQNLERFKKLNEQLQQTKK